MIVPPWVVVVVVMVSCWRLFRRWRRTRSIVLIGEILNRLLCFAAIYLYFMFSEPVADDRALVMRWMIVTFFIGEIILDFFSRERKTHV